MRRRMPTKKLKPKTLLSFLRDAAGTATVETAIIIPAFIVIWGSILYTYQRYSHAITASQYARAHTWDYAYNGCEDEPSGATRFRDIHTNNDGFIDGSLWLIFEVGLVPGFDLTQVEGENDAKTERPSLVGGGEVETTHNLTMLCNETPEPDRSMIRDALDAFGLGF